MGTKGVKDLFSDDINSHWVALNPNTADFKNYVYYQFKKIECITGISISGGYSTNRSATPKTRIYHGFPYVMNIYARNIKKQNFELVYVCAGFPPIVEPLRDANLFEFPDGVWTDELKIEFEEVSYNKIYSGVDDYKPAARMLYVRRKIENSPRLEYKPKETDQHKNVSISRTSFNDIHEEVEFGGAVYIANCKLECTNINFTNCSSETAGGGIYLNIKNQTIDNNSATFTDLTFTDCKSGYGGAICVIAKRGQDTTSIVGCTFNSNIALNSILGGSALFLYTNKAKVQRCTFTGSSGSSTIIRYATTDPSEPSESTTATILSTDFEFEVRDCIFEDQHQDSTFYINIDETIQQSPHILLTNNQLANSTQLFKTTFQDQHHNDATTKTSNNNNRTNNRNIILMILIPSLVVISLLLLLILYRHHNDNHENSQETNNNA